MSEVSTWRLYLMRALYALIAVGLGSMMWPRLLHHGHWGQMEGVAFALLGTLATLAALGVRYPLQMLPILLFELLWKSIWLLLVALPLWKVGQLDAGTLETVRDSIPGIVICPIVIPWGYVYRNYVKKHGDRWWGSPLREQREVGSAAA